MGRSGRRWTAAAAAAVALLGASAALAQTADPELSCVPDAVVAGGTLTCTVTGVAPSRAVDLELRAGAAVLASADGVAATDGTATVTVTVPGDAAAGAATVALVGTSVSLPVTVSSARPTTVAAGLGPSAGDVARTLPAAAVLAVALALALVAAPGLRRRWSGARP